MRHVNMPALYKLALTHFTHACNYHLPDKTAWQTMLLRLAQLSLSLREYAIMTVADIEPLWTQLRAVPHAVDVLTYAISDVSLEMEITWDDLARHLAEALHQMCPQGDIAQASCAMDVAFVESFGDTLKLDTLLASNRWLMFLMLLRRSGMFNLADRQMGMPMAPAPVSPSAESDNRQQGG